MHKRSYKFKKMDAFATEYSDGNPAGTIWLTAKQDINESQMQKLAKELKGFVSEVGYIHKIEEEKYGLRYYSSEREVNFCGHATIALMYELFKTEQSLIDKDTIKIITNNGELDVENRIKSNDAVFIMSPSPKEFAGLPTIEEVSASLHISNDSVYSQLPIKLIDAGLRTLIVPILSLETIIRIEPDVNQLSEFCVDNEIDIIEVFTKETAKMENDYRVRVFAPRFGYLEDPATGSGNSALGYYLMSNNMWDKGMLRLEQNNSMERFNLIQLQRKEDSNKNQRVLFGGGAIKRIEGEYHLYTE
ncbi:PhzF family phenazine biosynthesis protein [Sediminispirochaeta smaragdinae]|uniref:Phenazine biosynthesis protein PhzF family n=1 Tax=Sediminispirochaeta smaragdinae (strain DSM 11293 / JCM 15392 / SEBR 4228) TaxID=573413 RepID=E1R9W8_SEDSS|nr:PhzF family phenazine biosynthesis protein [Sediminispirochaeta smaragdinae]ADK83287.1 phenazine biosynthesis protein PhzF family [Sediminispirochaeta smaragdinae DSM 11293]